jgi:hypothetical protein
MPFDASEYSDPRPEQPSEQTDDVVLFRHVAALMTGTLVVAVGSFLVGEAVASLVPSPYEFRMFAGAVCGLAGIGLCFKVFEACRYFQSWRSPRL